MILSVCQTSLIGLKGQQESGCPKLAIIFLPMHSVLQSKSRIIKRLRQEAGNLLK